MSELLDNFHFLRPLWCLALLPLAGLCWLLLKQQRNNRSWQRVIDPALLPYLLGQVQQQVKRWPIISFFIGGLLVIGALAGPTWQQLEQPVFRQQSALVILLDLSRSMDATDIKPSRITRAHLKLRDILNQRKEGDTAFIVYAAHPFVVTPLTEDTRTITSQLSSLNNELMPSQGSRADRALQQALDLLQQTSISKGSILLITDGIALDDNPALDSVLKLIRERGHQLLILGVGSKQGGPIPLAEGGFFKDNRGNIVIPRMHEDNLTRISQQANGHFYPISANEDDIHGLLNDIKNHQQQNHQQQSNNIKSDQWQEQGAWLLFPVILFSLLIFRRGYLVLLFCLSTMLPQPASAFDWDSLWMHDDQAAAKALANGDYKDAAQQFRNLQWRAHANYQAGDYQQALTALNDFNKAQDLYNRGNTLAQLNRIPEAIAAYDEALKKQSDLQDAIHNRDLLKQWLEQQQEKEQNQEDQEQSEEDSNEDKSDQEKDSSSKEHQGDAGKESKDDPQQSEKNNTDETKENEQKNTTDQQEKNSDNSEKMKQSQNPIDNNDEINESEQALEQWLRRIPDDPGGLWRRKFLYQYQRQQQQGDEQKSW